MFARTFYLKTLLAITLIAIPSITEAAYNWTSVAPSSGGTGSGTSQQFGAVLEWGSNDPQITSINAYTYIVIGSSSATTTYTPSIGSLRAAIQGTVTFTPALNSGDKYTIVITGVDSNMTMYTTTITLTVP